MKALKRIVGDSTYKVVDSPDNRFNFFGLVEVDNDLLEVARTADYYNEWDLSKALPEDVKRAVTVMAENGADVDSYSGVITFTDREGVEDIYYLLTW